MTELTLDPDVHPKDAARAILHSLADERGPTIPFGSGHVVLVATRAAKRLGKPQRAHHPQFLATIALLELEKRGWQFGDWPDDEDSQRVKEWDGWIREQLADAAKPKTKPVSRRAPDPPPITGPVAVGSGDHKTLAREVLHDVGRGLPHVGIGSGQLVRLSIDEATRKGNRELATDRDFLTRLAREHFRGSLGGSVLGF